MTTSEKETDTRSDQIANRSWVEITGNDRKASFQEILRMLLDYDEKSGRAREYGEPELHCLRLAIAVADPATIRLFLTDLGEYMYQVVAELDAQAGRMATTWVHEDGIRQEREDYKKKPQHPVHTIPCCTDCFAAGVPVNVANIGPDAPGQLALELMLAESLLVD